MSAILHSIGLKKNTLKDPQATGCSEAKTGGTSQIAVSASADQVSQTLDLLYDVE